MCCKPRVLTFDEFLSIPPCTTGKHSTVDDTPAPPETKPAPTEDLPTRAPVTVSVPPAREAARAPQPAAPPPEPPAPEPETEDDDPSVAVPANASCRRRGCGKKLDGPPPSSREGEECIYHSGNPIFHEGSKGWTCCKRKVLEFDEFLRIEGCQRKDRHLFVGSGKPKQKKVDNVRWVAGLPGRQAGSTDKDADTTSIRPGTLFMLHSISRKSPSPMLPSSSRPLPRSTSICPRQTVLGTRRRSPSTDRSMWRNPLSRS